MSDRPPTELPGYELLQEIGSGGMATVYLAIQKSLDRKVAIKILRTSPNEADPERTEKRFLREGKTLAKISHKNVCGIYDIAQVGDVAYIAMEYLEGGTLVDHLREGISAGEAIAIVVQVAAALGEAHAQGIVHRDLKPANVMMRGGKVPVLTDFGIARELTADQTRITADNMIVGTPIYMSPEQVSGGEVDGRSDLYSLGIMFYELLTGQPPYQGDTPIAVCMQHLTADIPQLSGDLSELNPILDKLLAKKPEDRYEDLGEFTRSLRQAFVHSDAFREVLRFDPNTPWSDQLRELGFSFDTLNDAELRAAVRRGDPAAAGRTTAKGKAAKKTPPPKPSKAPAQASEPKSRPAWLIPVAGVALALLIGLVGWMMLSEKELTPGQISLLKLSTDAFEQQMEDGQLVQPAGQSALDSLTGMHEISRTHKIVTERERQFREAVTERLEEMIEKGQSGLATTLLSRAQDVLGDEYEALEARRSAAYETAENDKRIIALVAELDTLRSKPGWLREARLAGALADLGEIAGPEDARYKSEVNKLGDTLDGLLGKAVDDKDIDRAQALRERIDALLPGSSYPQQADQRIATLMAQLQSEQTLAALTALLNRPSLGVEGATQASGWIDALRRAGGISQLPALEAKFLQMATTEARAATRSNNMLTASAILDPSIGLFPDDADLKSIAADISKIEQQLRAERVAEEKRQKAGRLALDATPWAQVVSITAADGTKVDLKGQKTTPFFLTVPEGSYTVVMQAPDGTTRKESPAKVTRGQDSLAKLQFATIDADSYLSEAGYR